MKILTGRRQTTRHETASSPDEGSGPREPARDALMTAYP